MKNKAFAILCVIVLSLTMIIPVCAVSTHIFDSTGTIGDLTSLEAFAQKIEDDYNYSVLLAVIDGAGDEGTYGYCRGLYEAHAAEKDGIALTYNYGDNKYAFYCAGKGEELFPERVQNEVLWQAFAYTENYFDGAYEFYLAAEEIINKAVTPAVTSDTANENTEQVTGFVPVERSLPLVVDNAKVLSAEEEEVLSEKLEELGSMYMLEIGVVTVDGYDGKDPQAFADDFYDYNGYGYGENDDGLIVVFNTGKADGNRNIAISTHGTAIDLLTDMEIDIIIEMMIPPIKNGNYAVAFDYFVSECENSFDTGISFFWIPVSILIGFALAYFITKIQASKLKTVRQQVDASDYVNNVMLTGDSDMFMYRNVVRTQKPKENSSSTHTSSSGRTHGGGNKSF